MKRTLVVKPEVSNLVSVIDLWEKQSMSTATLHKYEALSFPHLENGLEGISKDQLEVHFKLYQGYVNNTNILNEKLSTFIANKDFGSVEYAELRRRLGFEFNGMILHEYYFLNLKNQGAPLSAETPLYKALIENFGSFEQWEQDFKKTGAMRGIGWAVLYQDPLSKRLFNFWITDHEFGHPAGYQPILVMDVWEHAYTVDYKATERPHYIDAFFKNVDWEKANQRLV
jgi:superoxide dismutase, Fe-Mn family